MLSPNHILQLMSFFLTTRTVAATTTCTCLVLKASGTPCFFFKLCWFYTVRITPFGVVKTIIIKKKTKSARFFKHQARACRDSRHGAGCQKKLISCKINFSGMVLCKMKNGRIKD